SRRRHTRFSRDWSSDVCSSDLEQVGDRQADAADGIADAQFGPGIEIVALELAEDRPDPEGGLADVARKAVELERVAAVQRRRIRSEERRVGTWCISRE